jgi:hypothetical protein
VSSGTKSGQFKTIQLIALAFVQRCKVNTLLEIVGKENAL